MKTPIWWTQLWCRHKAMIRGRSYITGDIWTDCPTCGRRTGAAGPVPPKERKQSLWKTPDFPPQQTIEKDHQ